LCLYSAELLDRDIERLSAAMENAVEQTKAFSPTSDQLMVLKNTNQQIDSKSKQTHKPHQISVIKRNRKATKKINKMTTIMTI
jgi:K+/H+ antiporter YhaU regulatory subunit KhtT